MFHEFSKEISDEVGIPLPEKFFHYGRSGLKKLLKERNFYRFIFDIINVTRIIRRG
jgi:hypothetical protein